MFKEQGRENIAEGSLGAAGELIPPGELNPR